MAVTLYYIPRACSVAIHALLIAAKVEYKLVEVSLSDKKLKDGSDYLKVNPDGTVPALALENGEILTQSAAISSYICSISAVETLKLLSLDSMQVLRQLEAIGICSDLHYTEASWFYGLEGKAKEIFDGKIHHKVASIEKRLAARSTKFWLADYPTFPDYQLTTILKWADLFNVDFSQYKHVIELKERVIASEAYAQACKEEGI